MTEDGGAVATPQLFARPGATVLSAARATTVEAVLAAARPEMQIGDCGQLAKWESPRCRNDIEGNDTMTSQAMTPHRTSPLSHTYGVPIVRELPSLPSAALGSTRIW